MKWIRCNNCYTGADIAKEPFSLTKCGHVYCTRCISKAERQCPICNTVNVPTVPLQEPLDPNIISYFTPMKDQLQQILAVCNFQEEQIRILTRRLNELDAKYVYCKEVCRKLEMVATKLHKKYRQDKEEYKKRLNSFQNENIQLKDALNRVQTRPYDNYRSTENSAPSSLLNPHACNKRFQLNASKVLFSTPLSTNSISNASSHLDGKYLLSRFGHQEMFQIPHNNKVPRSTETRSSTSTGSTSLSKNSRHLRLDSLMM